MALLFSAVTVTTGNEEIEFTVGGIPREYDDLVGWTAFDDFMENVDAETEVSVPKAVTLSIGNKILHFSVSEIRYVESYNHNIIIHQSSGNSNTYYLSLTEFEKQLPKGHFSRCHNSFLVNLSRVKEIGRTDLTLRNGDMLPVGRTYYKAFQSAFIRYINQ